MADGLAAAGQVHVRAATDEDGAAVALLSSRTFSASDGVGPGTDAASAAPAEDLLPALGVVAERGGHIVGAASARLRGQWFGGRRMLCAAVGGVAVDLEARGLGVGRAVMTGLLAAVREAGAVTSALIPSTHRFYTSIGYGVAGRRPVYAISTFEIRSLSSPRVDGLLLRRAVRADGAAVALLVARRAARAAGLLDNSGDDARLTEDPTGPDSYVVEVAGRLAGWCLLTRREPSSRLAIYDLVVQDLVADDPLVELAMWQLLVGDYPSAVRAEAVIPPGSVLEHRLERQRDIVEDASWMLSLVDIDAALGARGYPTCLTADLVLRVEDSSNHASAGTRRLTVAGGTAVVHPVSEAVPDATVTASDLASMFSGHLDPVQALQQGRLRADQPTAATLRALLAGPPPWLARSF